MNHTCLKINPRETDWVMGVNSPIQMRSNLPSGNWLPYIEFFERQMISNGDTDGCVCFEAQEHFDAMIEWQIQTGKIPQSLIDQFAQWGYMDTGTDGKPHFHSSPRWIQILTGNGYNGNAVQDAWDVLRKYGPLPWTDLPVTQDLTLQNYLTGITPTMYDKAAQCLSAIGGKNAIQYHWVTNGKQNIPAMVQALQMSPLSIGVNVNTDWNEVTPPPPASGANPGHCVMNFQIQQPNPQENDIMIYDHYQPNPKDLQNWPVWYALQAVITVNPLLPPPTPLPPNPTIPQEVTWLDQIKSWLLNLLEWLQGGERLQGAKRSPHWPAVRKAFLKLNPECKVCNSKKNLEAHHILVFHLNPSEELNPQNLIALCRVHHFEWGHYFNWSSWNKDVRAQVAEMEQRVINRPKVESSPSI